MEVLDNPEIESELLVMDQVNYPFDYEREYYVAGPMSGYREYNFPAFEAACVALRDGNIKIRSPHEIDHGESEEFRGSLPYETYMEAGLRELERCEGIILLPGWPQSTGAMRELQHAVEMGMPVYHFFPKDTINGSARLVCMNHKPIP